MIAVATSTLVRALTNRNFRGMRLADLEVWFESPNLRLIGETDRYWGVLREVLRTSAVVGPMVHDARIAAICRAHGVVTLLSADRDFSRFGISLRNPLMVV